MLPTEARKYLGASAAARAVYSALRLAPFSAGQLGRLFGQRFALGTVYHAVLELRRFGLLRAAGRYHRARQWRVCA